MLPILGSVLASVIAKLGLDLVTRAFKSAAPPATSAGNAPESFRAALAEQGDALRGTGANAAPPPAGPGRTQGALPPSPAAIALGDRSGARPETGLVVAAYLRNTPQTG